MTTATRNHRSKRTKRRKPARRIVITTSEWRTIGLRFDLTADETRIYRGVVDLKTFKQIAKDHRMPVPHVGRMWLSVKRKLGIYWPKIDSRLTALQIATFHLFVVRGFLNEDGSRTTKKTFL